MGGVFNVKTGTSFLWHSNYRPLAQSTAAPLCCLDSCDEHFLSATLDQRTGRNDSGVRKGQDELSPFLSTRETIFTEEFPLGLRSHSTSTVCSHKTLHFLKLTR